MAAYKAAGSKLTKAEGKTHPATPRTTPPPAIDLADKKLTVRISTDLMSRLKVAAAVNDLKMQEATIQALEHWLASQHASKPAIE